jgi:hypothetical protein
MLIVKTVFSDERTGKGKAGKKYGGKNEKMIAGRQKFVCPTSPPIVMSLTVDVSMASAPV